MREFIHLAVAFGGGVLEAAIAFALVSTGLSTLPSMASDPVLLRRLPPLHVG